MRSGKPYLYVSVNAGIVWDSNSPPASGWGPMIYFPKSSTIGGWGGTDSGYAFIITRDLGKSYAFNKVPQMRTGPYTCSVNPFSAGEILTVTREQSGTDVYCEVYRSVDTGKTWTMISSGPQEFGVLFDLRQRGLWYVNGTGGTYRTSDDGETFAPIGYAWGEYCGISAPGVFRKWLKDPDGTIAGVIDEIAEPGPSDTALPINWIARMDTLPAKDDRGAGYYHSLNHTNYSISETAPEQALITNLYELYDPQTYLMRYGSAWAYRTTNDGFTWQITWGDTHPVWTTIQSDTGTSGLMWLISSDTVSGKYRDNALPRHSLWRKGLPDEIDERAEVPHAREMKLEAFPSPAQTSVTLRFSNVECAHILLKLVDVRGRLLYRYAPASIAPGEHTAQIPIPGYVPAGSYFVELRTPRNVLNVPIIITR
jgi:hypothetical protein